MKNSIVFLIYIIDNTGVYQNRNRIFSPLRLIKAVHNIRKRDYHDYYFFENNSRVLIG